MSKIISQTKYGQQTNKIVYTDKIEIKDFDYSPAFTDELQYLDGDNTLNKFCYVFPNTPELNAKLDEICTYYWCNGRSLTDGQRKLRDEIIEKLYGLDFIFKKDNFGLGFYDLNEICGSAQEIKIELKKIGIRVRKIMNNRRLYVIKD